MSDTTVTVTELTIVSYTDGKAVDTYHARIASYDTPAVQAEKRSMAYRVFRMGCEEYPGVARKLTTKVTTVTVDTTMTASYLPGEEIPQ